MPNWLSYIILQIMNFFRWTFLLTHLVYYDRIRQLLCICSTDLYWSYCPQIFKRYSILLFLKSVNVTFVSFLTEFSYHHRCTHIRTKIVSLTGLCTYSYRIVLVVVVYWDIVCVQFSNDVNRRLIGLAVPPELTISKPHCRIDNNGYITDTNTDTTVFMFLIPK